MNAALVFRASRYMALICSKWFNIAVVLVCIRDFLSFNARILTLFSSGSRPRRIGRAPRLVNGQITLQFHAVNYYPTICLLTFYYNYGRKRTTRRKSASILHLPGGSTLYTGGFYFMFFDIARITANNGWAMAVTGPCWSCSDWQPCRSSYHNSIKIIGFLEKETVNPG